MGSSAIRIIRPGLQTTVQDRGRFGYEALGIPRGGALDLYAFTWANRLAGNPLDAAVLEVTLQGPTLTVIEDCWIATSGAGKVMIDGLDYPSWNAQWIPAGATVALEQTAGARAYLAVHGGFDVPPVLGSRSTDLSSGFGGFHGRALQAGDELSVDEERPLPLGRDASMGHPFPPQLDSPLEIHVVLGPRQDAFPPEALCLFLESTFVVTPQSNRMGLRLKGPRMESPPRGSRISEAMPVGGIQVPPDGQPIVLLNDRGTVGGYPPIATVITADIWRLGQARPGQALHFRPVSVRAGQTITRMALAELHRATPVRHERAVEPREQRREPAKSVNSFTVHAPTAGVFYRSWTTRKAPLVQVGTDVQPNTVVGLIEIMKTFEAIRAGVAGRIRAIHVEDGDPVSEGQAVMTIEQTGQ